MLEAEKLPSNQLPAVQTACIPVARIKLHYWQGCKWLCVLLSEPLISPVL